MKHSFEVHDRVLFGRSVMEFVGTVTVVSDDAVIVNGLETACGYKATWPQTIKATQFLRKLSDEEWEAFVSQEPGLL